MGPNPENAKGRMSISRPAANTMTSLKSTAMQESDDIVCSANANDYKVIGPDGNPIDVEELVEAFQEVEEEVASLKLELLQAHAREAQLRSELSFAHEGVERIR